MITKTKFYIDLMENEERSFLITEIPFIIKKDLKKFCKIFSPLLSITLDPTGQSLFLKAGSKVGVLNGIGVRVHVRPKLSVGEFCALIRYAINGKITPEESHSFTDISWGMGFENVLCFLLCEEIRNIIKKGISRRYKEYMSFLRMIRGRVLWKKNFPWLRGESKEIFCNYHQLTYDNIDNQIVLSGLKRAFFLVRDGAPEIKRQVGDFLKIFSSLATEKNVNLSDFQKAVKKYDRLNEHYRVAHTLAKMLLFNLRPEDFFKEGEEEVFGIVIDMAEIFEKFVERFVSDLIEPKGFSIHIQYRDCDALKDGEGSLYAQVKPDIEVWFGNKAIGIIDAKYKDYWAAAESGLKPDKKISNEDIYQLFFYQQRMQRKYELSSLPFAFLAAPLPADDERKGKMIIPDKFRRIRFNAGFETEGEINLLLIPITHFLRLIKKGIAPKEAALRLEKDLYPRGINWL